MGRNSIQPYATRVCLHLLRQRKELKSLLLKMKLNHLACCRLPLRVQLGDLQAQRSRLGEPKAAADWSLGRPADRRRWSRAPPRCWRRWWPRAPRRCWSLGRPAARRRWRESPGRRWSLAQNWAGQEHSKAGQAAFYIPVFIKEMLTHRRH